MSVWWHDLSSAELRARIGQRHPDLSAHQVAVLVAHRDRPAEARRITALLAAVRDTRPL